MATKVKLTLSGSTDSKTSAFVDAKGEVSWAESGNGPSGSTEIATLSSGTLTLKDHKDYNITVVGGTNYKAATTITGLAEGDSVDAAGFKATVSTGVGGVTYTNVDTDDEIALTDKDSVTFASSAEDAVTVKLPTTAGTVTVGGKAYTVVKNGGESTVSKAGTVALKAAEDSVTFDGVTYTAKTTSNGITVAKDGTAKDASESDALTVSAAEGTTATVTLDESYEGKLTVDKAGKGTVNVVGLTNLDNLTAEGTNYTVDTSKATLSADSIKATVGSENVTYGAKNIVIAKGDLASNQAYYTATIKDKGADSKARTTNYAWSKFDGDVTIDLSSSKDPYKVLTGTKGASTVLTGAGKDSIIANTNDTVNAGKGDDVITVSGAGVTIVKNQNTNNDSVTGFAAGFDSTKADVVKLDNATGLSKTSIAAESGSTGVFDVTLYTSSTKNSGLTLKAAAESEHLAKVKVATGDEGVKNYEFIGNTYNNGLLKLDEFQAIDADADAVYGSDEKGSGVKLASKTTDTNPIKVINLSGINNAKIGDTRTYGNISYINASESDTDNILVTSGTMDSYVTVGSGKSSVWGGVSTVSGATAANDTFDLSKSDGAVTVFTGAANGKDTVVGFDGTNGDLVYAYGDNKLTSLTENVGQQQITLGFADGTELTLNTTPAKTSGTTATAAKTDSDTTLNMYATAWGDSVKAQVGTYMTASKDTAIYYATRSATLEVTNDFDGDKLWLYQEVKKDGYTNAKVNGRNTDLIIDATSRTNDVNIAGTSKNDTILAGSGTNALFGGAGTDALYGNADGQTTFYFGKDLGADTTVYVKNSADKVVLYNVTASDLASTTYDKTAGTLTLTTNDGSKLTINGIGMIGDTISLSGTDYKYDSTGSALQKKA